MSVCMYKSLLKIRSLSYKINCILISAVVILTLEGTVFTVYTTCYFIHTVYGHFLRSSRNE